MGLFKKIFRKKRNLINSSLDKSIELHENFNYSSKEKKAYIGAGLKTLQKLEEAEQALKNNDIKRAVKLFEEVAKLTPKEEDKKAYLAQAANLKRLI